MLTKKLFFFGARFTSKLVYIGAQGAFRKILGSVGQKWVFEKLSKGGPFGSSGGRNPEGGGGWRRTPPKSDPGFVHNMQLFYKHFFHSMKLDDQFFFHKRKFKKENIFF